MEKEQWGKIEENVDEAEKARRTALRASKELYNETGVPKSERELSPDTIIQSARRKRVAEKALARETDYERQAEDILGKEGTPERVLAEFRKENLITALKKEAEISDTREALLAEKADMMKGVDREPSGSEQEVLLEIEQEIVGLQNEKKELMASSPEAYYGLRLKELKGYKRNLEDGKIVETPYVKEQMEDIEMHLRAGKPTFIYGHLGSGKSEVAMHIARKYSGQEPLIISGSKYTTLSDFFGHQVLATEKVDEKEVSKFDERVRGAILEWENAHSGADTNEKALAQNAIFQAHLAGLKGGTISKFFKGPIYQAAQEGKIVIEDEMNAIPHEVLISQNHILTRKPGDTITVQQDSGEEIEIKDGFGVIMTGNLNQGQETYKMRQDMDPAFLSRVHKIEYDYLPQSTDKPLAEAGEKDELFHLLAARVMDRNGNIEVPENAMEKLWKLAEVARVTQDVFAGREVGGAHYLKEAGGRSIKYFLKEAVLSLRGIDSIISQWQKEGYKYELDYYVWKEFVSQSTQASDRAYLYQELKDRYGFFTSDGWEQNPNYGSGGVINSFNIGEAPKNPAGERKILGPREVVDFAYGKDNVPERTSWPKMKEDNEDSQTSPAEVAEYFEKIKGLEVFKSSFANEMVELKKELDEFCHEESRTPSENKKTSSKGFSSFFRS